MSCFVCPVAPARRLPPPLSRIVLATHLTESAMDIQIEEIIPTKPQPILSYDETPYQEQLPTEAEQQANSLANRIGHTKVYLLSESTIKAVKVRWRQ